MKISKSALKRQKEYTKYALNHFDDMAQINQLQVQVRKLINKYRRMKKKFIKKNPTFSKRMEAPSFMRTQIKRKLHSKHNMKVANRKELMQVQKGLRMGSFYDRVRLMEIIQMYGSKAEDPWKYGQLKDVWRLTNKRIALKRSLNRLNEETLITINDIYDIESAIPFFQQKYILKRKVKRMPWWPTIEKYKLPAQNMSSYMDIQ